jgi:hypothetical protein
MSLYVGPLDACDAGMPVATMGRSSVSNRTSLFALHQHRDRGKELKRDEEKVKSRKVAEKVRRVDGFKAASDRLRTAPAEPRVGLSHDITPRGRRHDCFATHTT